MILGAQLYTLREFTKTEDDIYATLKKIKEIGYNAVQFSAMGNFRPDWMRGVLDEIGLKVCATHTPLDRILNDTDNVIAEHKLYGCKYVGLGFHLFLTPKSCINFLDKMSTAINKIAAADMKFLYHNHNSDYKNFLFKKRSPLDILSANSDASKFGFIPDFYWATRAGLNPAELALKLEGRAPVVHYKDMKADKKMTEIFEGIIDYDSVHTACLKTGVEYAVVEQDFCEGNPFDSLAKSYHNIKERLEFDE